MGVCADDGGNFSIKKSADRNFLARGLAVNIDNDIGGLLSHLGDDLVEGMERILENRLHKGARLHVDHADFSLCRFQHDRAVPGRTRWIIYRPEQARFEIKKSDDVFLVPNMIAGGED